MLKDDQISRTIYTKNMHQKGVVRANSLVCQRTNELPYFQAKNKQDCLHLHGENMMNTTKFRILLILLVIMNIMAAATIAYGRAPSISTKSFTTQWSLADSLKVAQGALRTVGYTEGGLSSMSVWGNRGNYKALIEARDISGNQRLIVITVAGPGGQAKTCVNEGKQLYDAMNRAMSGQQSREGASAQNKEACEDWCKSNSNCAKCNTNMSCGRGYNRLKGWTGRGANWYACGKQ